MNGLRLTHAMLHDAYTKQIIPFSVHTPEPENPILNPTWVFKMANWIATIILKIAQAKRTNANVMVDTKFLSVLDADEGKYLHEMHTNEELLKPIRLYMEKLVREYDPYDRFAGEENAVENFLKSVRIVIYEYIKDNWEVVPRFVLDDGSMIFEWSN